jgi:FtsP/CotA-like multicopper oxidase with cupredoxin domain
MDRRNFIKVGGALAGGLGLGRLLPAQQAPQMAGMQNQGQNQNSGAPQTPANFTLKIAPVLVELAPSRNISTVGYNGTSPGPLIRVPEGKPVTIDVINDTDVPELVHWHGQLIPSEVDGAEEEGTPMIPPHGRYRYQFTPKPAGSRWYHTHTMAGTDLHRGTYTGQYGFFYIDSGKDPGKYDQEHFLALRDWEPFLANEDEDDEDEDPNAPTPEKPTRMARGANGYEAVFRVVSMNDKLMGGGPPIQVKQGQRLLFHFLNACPTSNRRIALTGHKFQVVALDGNPVPSPQAVDVIFMGPGERVDCFVDMNRPGVWALGAVADADRNAGLGIIVEYENQKGQPQFLRPANRMWDYTAFGRPTAPAAPAEMIDMVFEKVPGGVHGFNHWTVNSKEFPHEDEFVLRPGSKYRIFFRNRTDDAHPVHIHRHLFEIVEINGKPTGGVMKDTVVVPTFGRVAVDLMADQPGLTLFHCHNQLHMDFGFKALFRYS